MSSPSEDEGELPPVWEETTKIGCMSGSPVMRGLYRWAEYHQEQFGDKMAQQGLTPIDLGIVHGETLQAGSSPKEYQEFMELLEAGTTRTASWDKWGGKSFSIWAVQVGIGCILMSVCWIRGQLCCHGLMTTKNRGVDYCSEGSCTTLCCSHSSPQ